jgi:hypothetical protein
MINVASIAARKALDPQPVRCFADGLGGWDCYFDGEQLPVAVRTLEQAKTEKLSAIGAYAASRRIAVREAAQPYATPEEMATWPIKRGEALAYQASQSLADAPTLAEESIKRETTLTSIVTRVIANAAVLATAEADIAGIAGKHKDTVMALAADPATTVEQVDAYDFSTGWPA